MQYTKSARAVACGPTEPWQQTVAGSPAPEEPAPASAPLPRLPSQFDSIVRLISESPHRFVVFERLGIPWYSDEGDSPLFEVCARHGLDVHIVMDDLVALDARRQTNPGHK